MLSWLRIVVVVHVIVVIVVVDPSNLPLNLVKIGSGTAKILMALSLWWWWVVVVVVVVVVV